MRTIGYSRSSSFTLGAIFTGLLVLGIYFIDYFMAVSRDQTLLKESVAAIDADIRMFREAEQLNGIQNVERILNIRISQPENTFFYALRDENSTWVTGNIPTWPEAEVTPLSAGVIKFDIAHTDLPTGRESRNALSSHYDIIAKVHGFASGYELIVGRDIDDLESAYWVGQTIGWLMIVIMVLISGTSLWVGFYVVSRINRIADTANNIMETGNLSARIPIDSQWDDLSKLSVVLNRLLSELEDMVKGVKSVSDNIAHDLRTPLTRLRGDIEQIPDDATRHTLLAETDNILSIFNGLLRIADIETEKQKQAFQQMDVQAIVSDVVELYQPLAEDKGIELSLHAEQVSTTGDRDLLFQAFANVIDNAIKFTPQEGCIGVTLSADKSDGSLRFSVCDSGIGISESDRDKVTRRFFRVEKSRHQPGNGLGLALVAAVVKLHRGQLSLGNAVEDEQYPGLCCSIALPAA